MNQTLAPTTGIHVKYWGAWNEPDQIGNEKGDGGSKILSRSTYPRITGA